MLERKAQRAKKCEEDYWRLNEGSVDDRLRERERASERASGGRSGNKKSPRIRGALALRARSRIYMGERELRVRLITLASGSRLVSPGALIAVRWGRKKPASHPGRPTPSALAHPKQHQKTKIYLTRHTNKRSFNPIEKTL